MYHKASSNLICGFHGCDVSVRDKAVNGGMLRKSVNEYDWLGSGIYFWENDPERALEWAKTLSKREGSSIATPSVVGAYIDLGNCLDLSKISSSKPLKIGYQLLVDSCIKDGKELPTNKNIGSNTDILLRFLDCAVINQLIDFAKDDDSFTEYDSVKGYFTEGDCVYPGGTFKEKSHIQICVINPNCIKGFFIPREVDPNYPIP